MPQDVVVSREEYPRTLGELESRFSDQESCRAYLERLRWPEGFRCPRCGSERAWATGRAGLRECGDCGHQASVTAGTIFQDTRTPLSQWFRAAWLVTSEKNGVSALGLQRQLGLGSYRTAWTWLHKLRRGMVRPGRERLSGMVEVDETYLGGEEMGLIGRETIWNSLVAVAAEEAGRGIGRIRLRQIADASAESLETFITESVEPGSTLHSDGWSGYAGVEGLGYGHRVSNLSRQQQLPHELMPRVHRVVALLKRWLLGTHQGSFTPWHLDYYLDEFTFRFNRRRSRNRGKLFYRLLEQAVRIDPAPYRSIVGGSPDARHKML